MMTTRSSQFGTASATLMRAPVSDLSCFMISPPRPMMEPIFLLLASKRNTVSRAEEAGAGLFASGAAPFSSLRFVPAPGGGSAA